MHRGSVRFVENDANSVALRELEDFRQWCNVAIHAENGLSDNQFPRWRADIAAKRGFQLIQVAVRVDFAARAGKPNGVDQAGVVERVGEDDVALSKQRGQQPEVGRVAAAEVQS